MWCLGRFLPLIIGQRIPTEDPHWLHYLQLLDIVDLVFAPTVQPDTPPVPPSSHSGKPGNIHRTVSCKFCDTENALPAPHSQIPSQVMFVDSHIYTIYTHVVTMFCLCAESDPLFATGRCAMKRSISTSSGWHTPWAITSISAILLP